MFSYLCTSQLISDRISIFSVEKGLYTTGYYSQHVIDKCSLYHLCHSYKKSILYLFNQ